MAKNKFKVPKKVGGVKVPRSLRKSGMVHMFLNNDLGRSILADVIVAAAAAAAAAMAKHRPSGSQIAHAGEIALDSSQRAASGSADAVHAAAGTLGNVVTEAVRYIFPSGGKVKKLKKQKQRESDYAGRKIVRRKRAPEKHQHH
jgi:hypothetical protein